MQNLKFSLQFFSRAVDFKDSLVLLSDLPGYSLCFTTFWCFDRLVKGREKVKMLSQRAQVNKFLQELLIYSSDLDSLECTF